MTRKSFLLCLSSFAVSFVFSGCGGPPRPEGFPDLCPCSVVLKQEGSPLAGAMVVFRSENPDFNWTVTGTTDDTGTAVMKTHAQFPGVPLGEYKIVVSKTERYQEKKPEVIPGGDGTAMTPGSPIFLYALVEKQYAKPETTPLTISIEKGKNKKEFDLGKPVREELEKVAL